MHLRHGFGRPNLDAPASRFWQTPLTGQRNLKFEMRILKSEALNPKSEIRNNSKTFKSKTQNKAIAGHCPSWKAPAPLEHLNFGSSNLFRIPSFELRI